MPDQTKPTLDATPEQLRYAEILEKGMFLGLALLLITFVIYATGMLKPYIAVNEISRFWSMNVHDYLQEAHVEGGWSWVGMLRYGDFINFVGIAILAGVTIFCFLLIIPVLLKNGDKIYAILAFLEVLVLGLAASGLLAVGH